MYIDPKNVTRRRDHVKSDDESNKEDQQLEGNKDKKVTEIDDSG